VHLRTGASLVTAVVVDLVEAALPVLGHTAVAASRHTGLAGLVSNATAARLKRLVFFTLGKEVLVLGDERASKVTHRVLAVEGLSSDAACKSEGSNEDGELHFE
jgi:hypothetical protein